MSDRVTQHGLHVVGDDGRNAFVRELLPCPFCGAGQGRGGPYVQVGPAWGDGSVDARVVCGCCHVATTHVSSSRVVRIEDGERVERDLAIEAAALLWNAREGGRRGQA